MTEVTQRKVQLIQGGGTILVPWDVTIIYNHLLNVGEILRDSVNIPWNCAKFNLDNY